MPSCTGCTNPMASSTRPALSPNSLSATGSSLGSTRTQCSFSTWPLPENFWVSTANSRSAPSSWACEVRSLSGQSGQVSSLFSFAGGCGNSSRFVTESAPWRIAVPMQSDPVSPPPMTMTCLRLAGIAGASPARERQVAGLFRAAGEHHRVVLGNQWLDRHIDADVGAVMEHHAFRLHLFDAARAVMLLHLEIGDAVR